MRRLPPIPLSDEPRPLGRNISKPRPTEHPARQLRRVYQPLKLASCFLQLCQVHASPPLGLLDPRADYLLATRLRSFAASRHRRDHPRRHWFAPRAPSPQVAPILAKHVSRSVQIAVPSPENARDNRTCSRINRAAFGTSHRRDIVTFILRPRSESMVSAVVVTHGRRANLIPTRGRGAF